MKGATVDSSKTVSASPGIGFGGLLTIVFIVLKLVGTIDWSWVWVLSPLWIGWGFTLTILSVVGGLVLMANRHTAAGIALIAGWIVILLSFLILVVF